MNDQPQTMPPVPVSCPRCGAETPRLVDGLCPACLARSVRANLEELAAPAVDSGELAPEIDGIEICELLGAGGMGAVFRGVREADGGSVAVKVLPRGLSSDPEWRERFQREAAALSVLDHPGIVKILATGETLDGRLFLAMELVEGCDLRRLLRAGRVEPERALDIAGKVAAALAHAHSRGIVHRDVKPGNILAGSDGVVKIADFGIARAVTGEAGSWTLTQTREAFGTPYYIAPELAADALAASPASDVYALGVVLYEMLTGRVPMGRYTPASQAAGLSPAVDALIAGALADNPAARLPDMEVFAARLRSVQQRHERQASRRRWRIAGITAAALLLTAAAGVWVGRAQVPAAAAPAFRSPETATRERPWENSLGLRFVPVPETPGVLMCIWETRCRDAAAFAADFHQSLEEEDIVEGEILKMSTIEGGQEVWRDTSWRDPGFPQTPDHPVVGAPMAKVRIFCHWLTVAERLQGRIGSSARYRLPSTEEWDRAFTAGPAVAGNLPGPEVVEDGWPEEAERVTARDGFLRTAPVGSFPPNAAGFHDLTGNVSEACIDIAAPGPAQLRFNYQARQALRGESWRVITPPVRRSGGARPARSHERRSDVGFRLVLDLQR